MAAIIANVQLTLGRLKLLNRGQMSWLLIACYISQSLRIRVIYIGFFIMIYHNGEYCLADKCYWFL